MDNLLVQINGRKRAVLYSPEDLPYLYLDGDKSRVVDIDDPDLEKYPEFAKATPFSGAICLRQSMIRKILTEIGTHYRPQ